MHKIKITKNIKTLDDLFARSDVNETLEKLFKEKTDIIELVVIYKTSNDCIRYRVNDIKSTQVLGLIEYGKNMILNPEDNYGDDE